MIPHTILNPSGERLAFSFTAGEPDRRDIVVLGHGLTSDKDRPWSRALAQALERAGIASIRIAFSGNGESEGRFVDSTITKEVADLGSVLDAFEDWNVRYVGHSMGAAVGLVRAATDDRIRGLVSLAGVTHAAEFVRRMFGHLRHGEPMLDKPHCPYNPALESDLLAWDSFAHKATEIEVPWLIVHGTDDDVVPVQHSLDLHAAATDRSELVVLDGVDHSFGADGLEQMIAVVGPWLGASA
ncbi:MAG: alpha/beta fold hydrolase [bacterium]|nr:alpha/beta fold hydrolase [bacterium]